ncbi:MAG: aspartate aminotransferase family protein [Candidatus Bathyarchaeota archaeon]|jgi:glutamate-1-semialdehyde 2,1-aminomutase|nr:aspartate aminotransferase family protein [Candidatus Bathyarchaeota archaeon]
MGYEEKTKRSKGLYARAAEVLPAGVSYAIRDFPPHPFYIAEAKGAKLTDVDGNVYTDYWMGHGALILGHAQKSVVKAVTEQLIKGTHFGYAHELEVELAECIVDMIPSAEMVRYTSSGTEANMYASRLARAYTGRDGMVKIEGGWHGGYDCLHTAVHNFGAPESAGLNPKTYEDTRAVPFNDLEAARRALKGEDVACLIIEPMMGAAGFLTPEPGYLEGLREVCDATGTLLIFDEVITGFRLSPGGAQPLYCVDADVTILGKIMGGGFPIGAFCGRREIFERLNHRKYPDSKKRSFHGGTFTGNPVSMVAGITILNILKGGKVHGKIDNLGGKVFRGLDDIISRSRIDAVITGVGSAFAVHFQKLTPRNAREMARNDTEIAKGYWSHLLAKSITYVSPSLPHSFIGEPHTSEDVEAYLGASEEFFKGRMS